MTHNFSLSRSGSVPSFWSSTAQSAAISALKPWCASKSTSPSFLCEHFSTRFRTLRAAAFKSNSSSAPVFNPSKIHFRQTTASPGISRSSPACRAVTRSWIPPQSLMTTPSKPHSSRKTPRSNQAFCEQNSPFTRLYALMTAHGFPSFTAISNAVR